MNDVSTESYIFTGMCLWEAFLERSDRQQYLDNFGGTASTRDHLCYLAVQLENAMATIPSEVQSEIWDSHCWDWEVCPNILHRWLIKNEDSYLCVLVPDEETLAQWLKDLVED